MAITKDAAGKEISTYSPALQQAWADLQGQVERGWIPQAAAMAEFERLKTTPIAASGTPALSPGLTQAQNDLQSQVAKGWITQGQADAEMGRLKGLEASTGPQYPSNLPLKTAGDVISSQFDISQAGQIAGNTLTNPNQFNPFGNQTTSFDPITGQPIVRQELSGANQQVISGVQGGAVKATDVLNSLLGGGAFQSLTNPSGASGPQPISNFEQSVFNRLTYGIDDQKAREGEQLSQTLANRGIPVGSDLYNDQMKQFNDRYDQIFQTARGQAVEQGTGQQLQSLSPLFSIGQGGYYAPSFQGFSPVNYGQTDVNQLFSTLQGTELGKLQISSAEKIAKLNKDAQLKLAQLNNQPAPTTTHTPFNTSPPPGAS